MHFILEQFLAVYCQDVPNTESKDDNPKPANENPKRTRCIVLIRGFYPGSEGYGYRPLPPLPAQEEGKIGQRYWIPYQGRRRNMNRVPEYGDVGPNYDLPDRGDVEFV